MKFIPLVSICFCLLASGCFMVPSPYAEQLNPVAARYRSVRHGAARAEVEAKLGQPTHDVDGLCVWETRCDARNYARMKIWFDPHQCAQKMEITLAHGTSTPSEQTTAEVTWTR